MKRVILFLFCLSAIGAFASEATKFSVTVVDFSHSWTSKMYYSFTDEEMCIVELDNINENKSDTLSHRQLLGKEKDLIRQYLMILSSINLDDEYKGQIGGDRNQKRISISLNDSFTKSIFVSNTYQQDIAAFIIFLNSFISEKNKMKEFVDPNKPKAKLGINRP